MTTSFLTLETPAADRGDAPTVLFVETQWREADFCVSVTDGRLIWGKTTRLTDICSVAATGSDLDASQFTAEVRTALGGAEAGKYEVTVEMSRRGLCALNIKICPTENVKIRLACIPLSVLDIAISEYFEKIATQISAAQAEEKALQQQLALLNKDRDEMQRLLKVLPEKRRQQQEARLAEFVLMLNSRKRKIRKLKEPRGKSSRDAGGLNLHLSSNESEDSDEDSWPAASRVPLSTPGETTTTAATTNSGSSLASGTPLSDSFFFPGSLSTPTPQSTPSQSFARPALRRAADARPPDQ